MLNVQICNSFKVWKVTSVLTGSPGSGFCSMTTNSTFLSAINLQNLDLVEIVGICDARYCFFTLTPSTLTTLTKLFFAPFVIEIRSKKTTSGYAKAHQSFFIKTTTSMSVRVELYIPEFSSGNLCLVKSPGVGHCGATNENNALSCHMALLSLRHKRHISFYWLFYKYIFGFEVKSWRILKNSNLKIQKSHEHCEISAPFHVIRQFPHQFVDYPWKIVCAWYQRW